MTERQGRRRQRSLRVPVDDVPRRSAADADASSELEMLVEPEIEAARPRTVPPPPPRGEPMGEPFEDGPPTGEIAEARTTDPGTAEAPVLESAALSEAELGAPMRSPAVGSELETEPTQVAVELRSDPEAPTSTVEIEDDIPGEPTREITVPEPPPPPPRAAPTSDVAPRPEAQPLRAGTPEEGVPRSPVAKPPEEAATAGVIVVGRTIAIGVGAPTFTTTAQERLSAPPDPPRSSAPPPPVEAEVAVELPPEPAVPAEAEAVAPPRADDAEELAAEELEEASSPAIERPKSIPPPAAPKPPSAGAPPPPPSEKRTPPKPPERKAPPAAPAAAAAAASADPDTAKRTRRKWWEELFNDDYLRTVPIPHPRVITRQSDFIEARLGLGKGATILDVGCGLGLHAIELTRRGYFVVGLDLSLPMLSRAADEARDQGMKINFVQGDMKEMSFDGAFDAVVSWGTSFGYFDDDANRAVVERFHRALKPGGLLLLDVVNRDHALRTQPNNCWFQGDGCVVMEETQLNYITSRLTVKRQVMLDDGRQLDTGYSIRLYSLHELGQILHVRGFRVVEVSGLEATPGVFFGAESPRLLIVAERRPDSTPSKAPPSPGAGETGPNPAVRDAETTPGETPAPGGPSSSDGS